METKFGPLLGTGAYSQANVSIWIPRSQQLTGIGDSYQETKVLQKVCTHKHMDHHTCMRLASMCMLTNDKLCVILKS